MSTPIFSKQSLPSLKSPPFVVGMPTETVYGLAARIDSSDGIQAIFRIKKRPFFDPLIVHVESIEQAKTLVSTWGLAADVLAKAFWPGPLTLVLPKNTSVNPMITSGLDSVGIRMPKHPLALSLIRQEGVPLAAPSANLFGRTSPTSAKHVIAEFGDQVPVIDGGDCQVGLESTVIRLVDRADGVDVSILRPGAIGRSEIEKALESHGIQFNFLEAVEKKLAPGQMKHHYMPSVPLIVVRDTKLTDEGIIKRIREGAETLPESIDGVIINKPKRFEKMTELVLPDEPVLASRLFYSELRSLAASQPDFLIFRVRPVHQHEAWEALFDRLTKAASLIV